MEQVFGFCATLRGLGLAARNRIPSRRPPPVLDPLAWGLSVCLEGLAPMADGPYSRLYWCLSDEEPDIFDDALVLGTYMQALVAAEQAWPTRPRRLDVDAAAWQTLVDAGLVIPDGRRYTIKGLDKERRARQESASEAARKRWDAVRNANGNAPRIADGNAEGNAEVMPSKAKQSKSKAEQPARDDIFDAYYSLTARTPSKGAMDWLERLGREYTRRFVVEAMATVWKTGPDPGQWLTAVEREARRLWQEAEARRKTAELDYQRREQEIIESMPQEQRAENLARLRDEMREAGLLS